MVELLAVMAVVGILVALASPSMTRILASRRVTNAAQQVADLARIARSRAMGRGSAMLMRWNANASGSSNEVLQLTIREAIVGSGDGKYRPATNCFQKGMWQSTTSSRYVGGVHPKADQFQPLTSRFYQVSGAQTPFAEICFTPRGRAFIRYSANGAFAPMNGVPRLELDNTQTSRRRIVVFPPNGAARVVTRL